MSVNKTPAGPHGPSAAANGGAADTGKHALSGPNSPSGTFASGEPGSGAGQPAPGGPYGQPAAANGQPAPSGPHDFAAKPLGSSGGPQGDPSVDSDLARPTAPANEGSEANPTATAEPAPKASAVLPLATSSISGDKPASTTSSATSAGSSGSSSKSSKPASAGAAGSEGPEPRTSSERLIFRRAPRALGSRSGQSKSRPACSACGATSSLSIPRSWRDYSRVACLRQIKSGS